MLRLTSEATRRRKLSEHSSGLSLSHRGQICYLKVWIYAVAPLKCSQHVCVIDAVLWYITVIYKRYNGCKICTEVLKSRLINHSCGTSFTWWIISLKKVEMCIFCSFLHGSKYLKKFKSKPSDVKIKWTLFVSCRRIWSFNGNMIHRVCQKCCFYHITQPQWINVLN